MLPKPLPLIWASLFALLLLLAPIPEASAQGRIEVGGLYHRYTGGFGPWYGGYVAGQYRFDRTTLRGEYFWHNRFGDTGISYLADVTHDFNARFYSRALVHTSSGGFFIPSLRTEAQFAAKWGSRNQFVTQVGLGYIDAKDYHRDLSYAVEAIYYFKGGWVAQANVRWNQSMPEAQVSRYHHGALSHTTPGHHEFVVRGAFGHEAYALVGPVTLYQNYNSWTAGVSYRHWLSGSWGVQVSLDHYQNSYFLHQGGQAGLFIDL